MNGPAPFTPVFVVPVGYLLMVACTSGMGRIFCSGLDLISASVKNMRGITMDLILLIAIQ